MIDALFDAIEGVVGTDFIRTNDPTKKHRGIINSSKLLIDAYGTEVIADETSLTTNFTTHLNIGEEIVTEKKDVFRIKNKSQDYRTRTITYGLEKTDS